MLLAWAGTCAANGNYVFGGMQRSGRPHMVDKVIFPFRGAELGGTHLAAFTLATALQRRSQLDCVVLCAADTLIAREADRLGLRVVPSGEPPTNRSNLFTDFSRMGTRRKILQGETTPGSVMHCNDLHALRAWGLAARLAGMGVVYQHHALNRLWWPPHLVSLTYADAVLSVSESTTSAMRRWRNDVVKELNPFEIDHACDRAAARQSLLEEFGWPDDARIVGWIGNYWARKRPIFFLEVAAELLRRDPRCRFVMFGRDGDYTIRDIRRRAAELGIDHASAIPGFRQPVESNLAPLDLLLAPAPREPFGRALVEALILGTPVVATRGAGHSEIIGAWGGGQLGNEDDTAERTAELCLETMGAADRYRLSPARRADLAAQLAPDAHADRMLAVYQRIVRSGPRRISRRSGGDAAKQSLPLV